MYQTYLHSQGSALIYQSLEEITALFEGARAQQMSMKDRVNEKDTHAHVERRESGDDVKYEV